MTKSQKWVLFIIILLALIAFVGGYYAWKARQALTEVRNQVIDAERQVQLIEARLAKTVNPPDLAQMNHAIPPEWDLARWIADVTLLAKEYNIEIRSVAPGAPIEPVATEEQSQTSGDENLDMAQDTSGGDGSASENAVATADNAATEGVESDTAKQEESFSPEPPSSLSSIHTMPLNMDVYGEVSDVLLFIQGLHRMPRLVWVTGFDLVATEDEEMASNEQPMNLRLLMNLYSQAPWDPVEIEEEWPFNIEPAGVPESFDTL